MPSPTRLLLVEDNPVDVRLIAFALAEESSWEIETTVAADGEQAMALLSQNDSHFDLVALDLNLPKCEGTDVLKLIRSTPGLASLPVIVLTSAPENIVEDRLKALNLSADAYLCKPIGASEFMQLGTRLRECYRRALGGARRAAGAP